MNTLLFTLKKAVASFLMPVPLVLLLGLLALLMVVSARHRRWGFGMLSLTLVLLFSASLQPVADALTAPLESEYEAYSPAQPVDFVVVLGAAHTSDPRVPVSSMLGCSGLYRLVEGVRVLRLHPEAKLLVSGYARFDPMSTAAVYRDLAVALGVAEERILMEPQPRDTAEEARLIKAQIGTAPFALVTSAWHMPRAMELFRQEGLHPIAAPTDYLAKQAGQPDWRYYIPDARALARTQLAWHEWLGRLWNAL